jgi:hypothetical protein
VGGPLKPKGPKIRLSGREPIKHTGLCLNPRVPKKKKKKLIFDTNVSHLKLTHHIFLNF